MKGLVLEGGGAKGAYHCGAYKALYDYGYRFDGVAGTSIGAINAALIVQDNGGYQTMYDLWTGISPSDIVDLDNIEVTKLFQKDFSLQSTAYWAKEVIALLKNLGVPTDRVLAYLRRHIDEKKVRSSTINYALVTYCLSDMSPKELFIKDIPEGQLHEYIFASAYYPLFKLQKMEGKLFIDGGIYDNLPTHLMAENGFDNIIAIRTKEKELQRPLEDATVDLTYIVPSESLGSTIDLYAKQINYNIKLGYYDAVRYIKKQTGCYYYITKNEPYFYPLLAKMNHEERERLRKTFLIPQNKSVITTLLKRISAERKERYNEEENIIKFLEEFAKRAGMEKFKVYSPSEFMQELNKHYGEEEPTTMREWVEYMLDKINRDKILLFTILDIYRRTNENE